jgi:hypothetical protein
MRTTTDEITVGVTTAGAYDAVGHCAANAAREPRVCIRCGAVHHTRRVSPPGWTDARLGDAAAIEWHATVCPHCQMASTGACGGEVLLVGAFVSDHQAEIERVIKSEVAHAADDNPPGRILRLERPQRGWLTVTTSTDQLARRIGDALHDVLRGTVHSDVPRAQRFARVTWVRDE